MEEHSEPASQSELKGRLTAYAAALRVGSFRSVLKRSAENWQTYAAATGAALAMASNASATVIYSGLLDQTVSVSPAGLNLENTSQQSIQLKSAGGANIGVKFNFAAEAGNFTTNQFGGVGLNHLGKQVGFLLENDNVKHLSSRAVISQASGLLHTSLKENGFVTGTDALAFRSVVNGRAQNNGWTQTNGFAGFEFKLGKQTDFGWVRLQFTVGPNTQVNSLTVIDWGYATGGVAINAGQGIPTGGVPEPSTAAMTLLAAGAAGVEFLRRRRKTSA